MILFFFSINLKTSKELLFYTFLKIGITICLFYSLKKEYQKLMMKIIYQRIFNNNSYKEPFDNNIIISVCFLRELFEQKNMKYLSRIKEFLLDHQNKCLNFNCACKIVKIKTNISKGNKVDFIEDLLNKYNLKKF